jgi:hypothetical protein
MLVLTASTHPVQEPRSTTSDKSGTPMLPPMPPWLFEFAMLVFLVLFLWMW